MVSFIIAQRNEPYLLRTIDSVVRACAGKAPEVIVVSDGKQAKDPDLPPWVAHYQPWEHPRGCMAARDYGILRAQHPVCIVMDGHMDLDHGLPAAYRDHLSQNERDVLCARCPGLDPVTWTRQNHDCSGAYVLWKDGPDTALSLKWRYEVDTGEIPAVLGACYGLRRDWYVDGLQRPWQYGTGWGTDEELLSISNWLCGGANIVMPFEAAHWFRDQKAVPYPTDAFILAGVGANRIRLLRMLPMTDAEREELEAPIRNCPHVAAIWRIIEGMLGASDPQEYRAWLAVQQRTWAEWKRLWCSMENPQGRPDIQPPGTKTMKLKRQPKSPPVTTPPPWIEGTVCTDTIPVEELPKPPAPERTTTRKRPEPNPQVLDPGIPCPHCGERYNHKVSHTYENGNRRRICGKCGGPFITLRSRDNLP